MGRYLRSNDAPQPVIPGSDEYGGGIQKAERGGALVRTTPSPAMTDGPKDYFLADLLALVLATVVYPAFEPVTVTVIFLPASAERTL